MKNKLIGLGALLTVFSMMCVLRWWFTIYVVFAFAIVMTAVLKKRNYCHNVCPIAFVQGVTYSKDSKTLEMKPKLQRAVKWVVYVLFWGLLIVLPVYYGMSGNYPRLWHRLLLLMVASLSTAILMQEAYGKRIWCRVFCPLGSVLDLVVKKVR